MKLFARVLPSIVFCLFLAGTACSSSEKKSDPAPVPDSAPPPIPPTAPGTEGVNSEALPPSQPSSLPWSYQGETGPAFWSVVDPLFALCGQGKKQSPIDLVWHKPLKGKLMDFRYKEEPLSILDNGYTVQVNFGPGQIAVLNGANFELNHLQFRTSSEHTISGNELPLELQLFHTNKKGKTAVVALIVIEGPANPVLEKFWSKLPRQKMQPETHSDVIFSPLELLPAALTYYKYSGSLTTPPCTEDVDWYVLNTPITASADQILAFRKLYSSNKRPLQPLNKRKVQNF